MLSVAPIDHQVTLHSPTVGMGRPSCLFAPHLRAPPVPKPPDLCSLAINRSPSALPNLLIVLACIRLRSAPSSSRAVEARCSNANVQISMSDLHDQQQPPLRRRVPSSLKTSSHSWRPLIHPWVLPRLLLCLRRWPSSNVMPLLMLLMSDAFADQPPLSPYCMPLCGSSGSISPSSILVRIIRASRENSSSTLSPDRADTSTATGMLCDDAHCDATSSDTSRPSGAIVFVFCVPTPSPLVELMEPLRPRGNEE